MKNLIIVVCIGVIVAMGYSRNQDIPAPQNFLEGLRQQQVVRQPPAIPAVESAAEINASRQACRTVEVPVAYEEQVEVYQEVPNDDAGHPVAGGMGGAIIGWAIGNQVGNGRGREVARAALSLTGLVLGSRAASAPATKTVPVMQTVQRTRYEQQLQCDGANAVRQNEAVPVRYENTGGLALGPNFAE